MFFIWTEMGEWNSNAYIYIKEMIACIAAVPVGKGSPAIGNMKWQIWGAMKAWKTDRPEPHWSEPELH